MVTILAALVKTGLCGKTDQDQSILDLDNPLVESKMEPKNFSLDRILTHYQTTNF